MEQVYLQINLRPLFAISLVQRQMIWSIIQFPLQKKTPKKLIIHAGTNDIYRNIDTIGNYEKIYNYVKINASKTELIFSENCCRRDRKVVMNEVKTLNKKIEVFCKSKSLALIRHGNVNQNCLAKKKLLLHEKGILTLAISFKIYLLNE